MTLASDHLSSVEISGVLAGADFEVRHILGQEVFGMADLLSKYHGVVACLRQEASINSSVLPNNQIPLRVNLRTVVMIIKQSVGVTWKSRL